jgi:predicted SprT family Zn-dependent metalloprotease
MGKTYNVKELQKRCKEIAKEIWDIEFDLPIKISKRMTKSLGSYVSTRDNKPICLKFSYYLVSTGHYNNETIESVIKHELCHWYICLKFPGKQHDGSPTFENEIKRIHSSSTRTLPVAGEIHKGVCKCCGKVVISKRKLSTLKKYFDFDKYSSGCCHTEIIYGGYEIIKDENVM